MRKDDSARAGCSLRFPATDFSARQFQFDKHGNHHYYGLWSVHTFVKTFDIFIHFRLGVGVTPYGCVLCMWSFRLPQPVLFMFLSGTDYVRSGYCLRTNTPYSVSFTPDDSGARARMHVWSQYICYCERPTFGECQHSLVIVNVYQVIRYMPEILFLTCTANVDISHSQAANVEKTSATDLTLQSTTNIMQFDRVYY